MSVTEEKAKFFEAKKAVENCTKLLSDLTKRNDDFQESLPQLKDRVEVAEKSETAAYDSHVLEKISAKELEKVKTECQTVKNQYAECSKMLESLGRGLKKTENDLQRLNAEAELNKRQCWQAIAEEIKSAIPSEVFESVKQLQVVGSQTGQTRQWILDSLFPNPSSGERQEITSDLCGKHNIE